MNIELQLGWSVNSNQAGELIAQHFGFFEDEGLRVNIVPGGPSADGVSAVVSGDHFLGQLNSSPKVMLARAAGIPIKCFAVGFQEHPFTIFSLKKNPVREPHDLIGKRIATSNTSRILIRALLAQHGILETAVDIVVMGSSMAPLIYGRVDAATAWQTNVNVIEMLGEERTEMRLWDAGIRLYALPYYVTDDTLEAHPHALQGFLRACSRGWAWAFENREGAARLLVEKFPQLNLSTQRRMIDSIMRYCFNENTRKHGWGAMTASNWSAQIALYDSLEQFPHAPPEVDEVMTRDLLKATVDTRPRIG